MEHEYGYQKMDIALSAILNDTKRKCTLKNEQETRGYGSTMQNTKISKIDIIQVIIINFLIRLIDKELTLKDLCLIFVAFVVIVFMFGKAKNCRKVDLKNGRR